MLIVFLASAIIIVRRLLPIALRLAILIIATGISLVLVVRVRRTTRAMLAMREHQAEKSLSSDHTPTRAQRRIMARGLRLAIQQTEMTSLFPSVAVRARHIVETCGW